MANPDTLSTAAPSEMPETELEEISSDQNVAQSFPPYPPYTTTPAPPSVADTVIAGHDIRRHHKAIVQPPVHKPPRPALPKGPKATDVKLNRRALKAHERCLRRHNAALTDRMERMSKPRRRNIIYLWREFAHTLPSSTIARLRTMLDADEPFKPDQAYEYFINLRRMKKKTGTEAGVNQLKKDILSMYGDKRFMWARNATVSFARGIQHKLSRPGCYALADGMLRLSDIILRDICGYMHMKTPSRQCKCPKAKFMIEMADKVAVWIDEILAESDDRMLMMDFDEDEDLLGPSGDNAKFEDAFLDMMGDNSGKSSKLLPETPAYLKFSGPMLEAFLILTDSMYKKGDTRLVTHGKFEQNYTEAADELKQATDFHATEYNSKLANQINNDLTSTSKSNTPNHIAGHMKEMVDICSKYLSQYAEYNKEKGPAFRLLVEKMRGKGGQQLYQKDKIKQTYGGAATELDKAKGLENDHDDPNLTLDIHSSMTRLTENDTPDNMKKDMDEAIDVASKYLSQQAVDMLERGPAFDLLIKTLEEHGSDNFSDFSSLATKFSAAYVLKSAPGLSGVEPDTTTASMFSEQLHRAVDAATPTNVKQSMPEVINRCANYLSAFVRDRDIAVATLVKMMKSKPKNTVASSPKYTMDYMNGATETEGAVALVPYLPIKDVADEGKKALTKDMEDLTPPGLKIAMKALIQDASRYLSQPFALRSGISGPRYPLEFLSAVKKSLGQRSLFKYKAYGQTYVDAANTLMHSGPLEVNHRHEAAKNLHYQIKAEMKTGIPTQIAPSIVEHIHPTIEDASKHLANVATAKGDTLEHLVGLMKEKGEIPLAQLQGYEQSYDYGAKRIENAQSLTNEKVDRKAYETVKGKLTDLTTAKPVPEAQAEHMPEMIEISSKFLSAPTPETNAEKRDVLADMIARKGDVIIGEQNVYKMTHKEGGEEVKKARVGQTTAQDEVKKKEILGKVTEVVPGQKMQVLLKDAIQEGAAHLTDTIKGRDEAMQLIQKGLIQEKSKDLLTVGAFHKTHEEGAKMLDEAKHFSAPYAAPVLVNVIDKRVDAILPKDTPPHIEKQHLDDAKNITSKYIASVATKESGLDPNALAQLDDAALLNSESASSKRAAPLLDSDVAERNREKSQGKDSELDEKDRLAKEQAERLAKEQAERLAKEQADRLAKEEAERLAKERSGKSLDAGRMSDAERLAKEEAERLAKAEAERLSKEMAGRARAEAERLTDGKAAADILHSQLRSRGGEVFYEQSLTSLTHKQASDWLLTRPEQIDKAVKESGDTARLRKKFEKKLSALTSPVTPPAVYDNMQDVVIESAQQLSEDFIATNYKTHARDALISEMQKRGNEILIEVDGAAETTFFAAQRVKKAKNLKDTEPCTEVAPRLSKRLETIMRRRSMPRKITSTVKEYSKDAADYLSGHVTKPNPHIEAYVSLLEEMESAGDKPLIEGQIPKSHREAAAYLRQLTTFEDKINRSDKSLQSAINGKLSNLMSNVDPSGYTKQEMNSVIQENAVLLTSYVTREAEKTKALNELVKQMDEVGKNVLLRHGDVRKSFTNGADMLRGKTTDQLSVSNVDPVVARKLEIKLNNLMENNTPDKFKNVMGDVIQDATMYLAVHLLEIQVIKICKCMKSKFVQCEMWCEEILRRVVKPPCTCSRHVPMEDIEEYTASQNLRICPGTSRTLEPRLQLAVTECRSKHDENVDRKPTCQAPKPSAGCFENITSSYLVHSMSYDRNNAVEHPTRLPPLSPVNSASSLTNGPLSAGRSSTVNSLVMAKYTQGSNDSPEVEDGDMQIDSLPMTPIAPCFLSSTLPYQSKKETEKFSKSGEMINETGYSLTSSPRKSQTNFTQAKSGYTSRTPISTDKMADWHAMMVSLLWNVEAWRKWIQENIDLGLAYRPDPDCPPDPNSWALFQRRICTEALQWRQYNIFSRKLTMRLVSRYGDKEIISRGVDKTAKYHECACGMLEIIDMFNRWTQWLILVVKETDQLEQPNICDPLCAMRWENYKKNILEYVRDWINYNAHLKVIWEKKFDTFITECVPKISGPGPLWVMSACGAVPSGAVAAGMYDGEVVWVARTTHRRAVLPAALHPSKHCCLLYADGASYHYTKYQVMCNVEVRWVAWRGGSVSQDAIQVAEGTYVGRVLHRGSHLLGAVRSPLYRCQVMIFGRPFAFNFYELLLQAQEPV